MNSLNYDLQLLTHTQQAFAPAAQNMQKLLTGTYFSATNVKDNGSDTVALKKSFSIICCFNGGNKVA